MGSTSRWSLCETGGSSFRRGHTAEQTNRNLQILAIVTTIFLPATLLTGIFGMNVMDLPLTQNPHGFFWSMVILTGSSALVFWFLKQSGILDR
ncbi:MAG TPA: CorA family divalent cation transporter [Methyloceanibacter sp.]|nr:CorA family divalent cation transporter [Methyloceanibacter sp.]